jgi:hypothetical protein
MMVLSVSASSSSKYPRKYFGDRKQLPIVRATAPVKTNQTKPFPSFCYRGHRHESAREELSFSRTPMKWMNRRT